MTGGILAYGLLAALAIALLVAAVSDLRTRLIHNWLTFGIAAAAPAFWWASGLALWPGGAAQLALGVAAFAILTGLFALRMMGGGDVKLLTALALWIPPHEIFWFVFMASVIGGAMSVYAGARNLALAPDERGRRILAVVTVALWLAASIYVARILSGARPFDFGAAAAAIGPMGDVIVYGGLLFAFATVMSGAWVIARRQKSKLPVPYGLAISTAGLWVIPGLFAVGNPVAG